MINGWKASSNTKRPRPSPGVHNVSITKVHSLGKSVLELSCENDQDEKLRLRIDPALEPSITPWIEIRGARKLLLPQVKLQVKGEKQSRGDNDSGEEILRVKELLITSALPTSPYLARLFSFSLAQLRQLFQVPPESHDSDLFLSLEPALAPCTMENCESLARFCREEQAAGRGCLLFKSSQLLALVQEMIDYQGWRRKVRDPPSTRTVTWEALKRLEEKWCGGLRENDPQDDSDDRLGKVMVDKTQENPIATSSSVDTKKQLVFGGVNVDPSLNLPDTGDARRQKYMDERKRPQIVWMLDLIERLVAEMNSDDNRALHLVDIGGGRGDLALAVAAYFADSPRKAHISVLDINQPSLEAGKERAKEANLDSCMSFVLCDLADTEHVQKFKSENSKCDLVFGLHCCGGVAEATVDFALTCRASFCVSTCCYCSNSHLASLSGLADDFICSETNSESQEKEDILKQHRRDRSIVSALAVKPGADGQHRAIHAINAMRLKAAERRFRELTGKDNTNIVIKTWQERFPVEHSVQNRVMVGSIKERNE